MKKILIGSMVMVALAGQAFAGQAPSASPAPKKPANFAEAKKLLVQIMMKREEGLKDAIQKIRSFRECIEKSTNESAAAACAEHAKKTLKME